MIVGSKKSEQKECLDPTDSPLGENSRGKCQRSARNATVASRRMQTQKNAAMFTSPQAMGIAGMMPAIAWKRPQSIGFTGCIQSNHLAALPRIRCDSRGKHNNGEYRVTSTHDKLAIHLYIKFY
jgi:hypothetical protein